MDPFAARKRARLLVEDLRRRQGSMLRLNGIELAGAIEQRLFFALRDGNDGPRPASLTALDAVTAAGALAAAGAVALGRGIVRSSLGPNPIVVLCREPTHYLVIDQIERVLAEHGVPLAVVRVGRAAGVEPLRIHSARLDRFADPRLLPGLARFRAGLLARSGTATSGWSAIVGAEAGDTLRVLAVRELGRIGMGAAALAGVVRAWRPGLLIAFDEVGTWARLLPAVARSYDIPSLDLPHAEAADSVAVRGAGYDRLAVYGRRSAAVLRDGGIEAKRIAEIGAPRFDRLVERLGADPAVQPAAGRRIVFAAQYESRWITRDVLAACLRGAIAAAAAVAPSELVIVPHPAGPAEPDVATTPHNVPNGVTVTVAGRDDLHRYLSGAWAMVTGWSNSILEAAIAGTPAITVDPGGIVKRDYAAEGLALRAYDEESAAEVARSLLDPAVRLEATTRARAALADRIGPLDGKATARAAALALELMADSANR